MDKTDIEAQARRHALSNKTYNKIFCIGYNKTGTTTLAAVLRYYGFTIPNQQQQEIRLTKQTFSTNYTEFCRFVSQFDGFQDLPFSHGEVYVAADALFPNSKFILTEREPEAWFSSLCRFHSKGFKIKDIENVTEDDILTKFKYLYSGYMHANARRLLTNFEGSEPKIDWSKLYDKKYRIQEYEQRNNQIKKYFMNAPDKLLVINVAAEDTTEKICDFLNIPQKFAIDMPHENKSRA